MKNRLKRLLGKKEKMITPAPFALTVLMDPSAGKIGWNLVSLGPVPYPLIYEVLDKCKAQFIIDEASALAQAQISARSQEDQGIEQLKPAARK